MKKKGMTVQTKVGVIIPVTLLMGFGFFMMMRANVVVPSVILAIIWVCHIIYFVFGVKTIHKKSIAKKVFKIRLSKGKSAGLLWETRSVYMKSYTLCLFMLFDAGMLIFFFRHKAPVWNL